jgi:hypothetical protein
MSLDAWAEARLAPAAAPAAPSTQRAPITRAKRDVLSITAILTGNLLWSGTAKRLEIGTCGSSCNASLRRLLLGEQHIARW